MDALRRESRKSEPRQKRRAVLIVEDDAELRSLTAALLEDEQLDTIEADVWLRGAMDGIDLAWEVRLRWPLPPVILTSGHPRECVHSRPGVRYKPRRSRAGRDHYASTQH